ncbi:MAG: outer membrane beta-barrel protein [Gammaproteobacteria bacterium]|nr:outer membrane beta-barrel protein [Gammaproteobacteria bacterium]
MNNEKFIGNLAGRHVAVAIGLLTCFALPGQAAELTGNFSAGVGWSDNIARTRGNELDESMGLVGAQINYIEDSPTFYADAQINANFLSYFDDTFGSELLGGANITGEYFFSPEVFSWILDYNYGQQVFNPLQPARPGNREDVSFLTTGPRLTIPMSSRWFAGVDLTYSNVTYERRPNNNNRGAAAVRFGRDISQTRNITINGTTEQVKYESAAAQNDFERNEVFMRFETASTRNQLSLDVGYSELQFEGSDIKGDGAVVRLDWTRSISQYTSFVAGGGRRFSDQGDVFRSAQRFNTDITETEDVLGVASPFRSDFANARYSIANPRFGVDVFVTWSDENYIDNPLLDRGLIRGGFAFNRNITRKITGGIGFNHTVRDFDGFDREDKDTRYTLNIGYQFSPAFNTVVDFQYFERSSDDDDNDINESRIFITVNYIPKWGR